MLVCILQFFSALKKWLGVKCWGGGQQSTIAGMLALVFMHQQSTVHNPICQLPPPQQRET